MVLLSIGNLERLIGEGVFRDSRVGTAIRANDTTDIWGARHGSYKSHPSLPHRSALIEHAHVRAPGDRAGHAAGADRPRPVLDHLHERRRARPGRRRALPRVPHRGRALGLQAFSRGLQPQCRQRQAEPRRDRRVRQRQHRARDRRRAAGLPAAVPEDRLQRPEGAGRACRLRPEHHRRHPGRRRRHDARHLRAARRGAARRRPPRAVRAQDQPRRGPARAGRADEAAGRRRDRAGGRGARLSRRSRQERHAALAPARGRSAKSPRTCCADASRVSPQARYRLPAGAQPRAPGAAAGRRARAPRRRSAGRRRARPGRARSRARRGACALGRP